MNAPCVGCKERHPLCHGKCAIYQTWKTGHDAESENRKRIRAEERMIDRYILKSSLRVGKKKEHDR